MTYPDDVVLRSISFGLAVTLESGDPLTLSIQTSASRSLIRNPGGYRLEQLTVSQKTVEAGTEIVIELPVTDQPGWLDAATRQAITVGDDTHSHLYTTLLTVFGTSGNQLRTYKIGPYPLPTGEGVLDGDTMLIPSTTIDGVLVPVPVQWEDWADQAQTARDETLTARDEAVAAAAAAEAVPATNDGIMAPILADPETESGAELRRTFVQALPVSVVARDAQGRVTSVAENGITETYTRDALGRVATITRGEVTRTIIRTPAGLIKEIA